MIPKFLPVPVLLILILGACSTKAPDPVRIAVNPWPGYEFLFLAREKGYFDELGVEVKLVELSSNGDVRRAFERHQVDVSTSTLIDLLTIRELSNRKPRAFFVCDFSNGADVILARKDIPDIGAIRGKRVAAEPASLDLVHLAGALEVAGLTFNDIDLIPMSQLEMVDAFIEERIDAAVTYTPNSFRILKTERAHEIFNTSMIPGVIVDIMIADEDFLQKRSEDLARIVVAFNKAVDYSRRNPDETHTFMAAREGVTLGQFREALAGMEIVPLSRQREFLLPGGQLEQSLRRTGKVMLEAGMIKQEHHLENTLTSAVIELADKL
ncbi:MAG: ABC transporter substrate-binding protein [Acidobacteriota bacterium]|nr:ABC transporter substrate-binding protein [Acidobacteriota bacterium]